MRCCKGPIFEEAGQRYKVQGNHTPVTANEGNRADDTPTLSTSPSIIGRNFVTFVFKRIFFTNVEFPSFVRANFSQTEIERIVVSPFFIYLNHCSFFCSKTKMLDFFTWHRIKEDALRLILCSCDLCNYVCSRCETDRGLGSSLTGIE